MHLLIHSGGRFWGLTGDIEGVRGPDNDGTRTQASECGHGALRCCRAVAGLPAREGLNGGCSYAIPASWMPVRTGFLLRDTKLLDVDTCIHVLMWAKRLDTTLGM